MKNRLRILLLLALALVLTVAGSLSANPKPKGLICGTPDDPIPCSTFNTATCTYTLDQAANCCRPSGISCLTKCC